MLVFEKSFHQIWANLDNFKQPRQWVFHRYPIKTNLNYISTRWYEQKTTLNFFFNTLYIMIIYMAHRKVNSPEYLKNGEFFFETPPKNSTNMLFSHFFTYTSDSWSKSFRKCQVSIFRCYLGCAPHTQSWVFFQNGKNPAFLLLS